MNRTLKGVQRGVAAIEFAFVMLGLLLAFYGIATFGLVLYTQQALARAAADGARAVQMFPQLRTATGPELATARSHIETVVWDSLAGSIIVPLAHSDTPANRRAWLAQTMNIDVTTPTTTLTVTVTYPYAAGRLLPWVPMFDTSQWMPATLTSRATAAL
ncbi:TadE/TadG family type IV pilus assembly protein [Hydrogenophaga laconesensis]|uniref:Flp pilus assembly protein TadG n=1 Tax=Hydrogenophaga laconesensis TaxID=1805971 RepID=A0ABU1VHS1_9BURK|nr:TadE/TadG family type IV pilus assembly protein [Hydrogenophaga laconesensis]MDR7097032.1 Flp pilus assembly protein TadG [Hydrogenophaga laconesensis]